MYKLNVKDMKYHLKLYIYYLYKYFFGQCLFVCPIRFQVRYGQHWAPMHPNEPVEGVLMTEILLGPEEVLTHLNAYDGDIIVAMQFTSNLKTYPKAGNAHKLSDSVPLNGLLYFSGASKDHQGVRVSKLVAHRGTCETL